MKLGVSISWRGATIDSSRAIALESDRAGIEYLWLTEAWGLEALSTAGYLLGLTSKIKLGIGVLNVFSRSAAVIGMACATLDQIAPNRFILGLGTSGRAVVERWHGEKFSTPLQRTREYVKVVKQVAKGEELNYQGEILKLAGFKLYTKPRESEQEIYIGAMGGKNLQLAGEISDGAIVTMYPLSKLSNALQTVRRSSVEGKEKKLFAYLPLKVARNAEEHQKLRTEVARNISFYLASMGDYYSKNLTALGYSKNVQRVILAHEYGGSRGATAAVDDELIDDLALVGSTDQIIEKLRKIPDGVVPVIALDAVENRLDVLTALVKELSAVK